MKNKYFIFSITLFLSLLICFLVSKLKQVEPISAFYFWENNSKSLSILEDEAIHKLNVKKLYIKFFEVEKSDALGLIPTAKSELHLDLKNKEEIEIIPTIYIRNEVFKKVSIAELQKLASNINKLVEKRYQKNFQTELKSFKEIQIDCDWTESTQKNYFHFLHFLKAVSKKQISATLRLYAYKFPNKMGILPVDKAMLMCYNLIQPMEAGNRNSILDLNELEKYLVGAEEYPIPLDIALPIYSAIQIMKQNKISGMFYDENKAFISKLKHINGWWYFLQSDTTIHEIYLRKGDRLKYEFISKKDLETAIKIIISNVSLPRNTTIAYYHLSESELKNYTYEELDNCYTLFKY